MTETDPTPLPTLTEAAAMLVDASAIDVVTERGDTIEVWTISHQGATVAGSAPRLLVAEGMQITCRLADGGQPIEVRAIHRPGRVPLGVAGIRSSCRSWTCSRTATGGAPNGCP